MVNCKCILDSFLVNLAQRWFRVVDQLGSVYSYKWITKINVQSSYAGASRAPAFQNLGARHKKWGPCNKCTFKSHCNYKFIQHMPQTMAVAYVAA